MEGLEGERMDESEISVRELEPYLRSDFDPREYSKLIVSESSKRGNSSSSLSASLAKLEQHQATVESTIAAHISQNNASLKERLERSANLKDYVYNMKVNANALSASLERISTDIMDPYESMKQVVNKMEKMQEASSALRKLLRFLSASRKLRVQLKVEADAQAKSSQDLSIHVPTNARDLAKSAQILRDVEELLSLEELQAIHVVESERKWLETASRDIRSEARRLLEQAIQALNQTEVGASLQAFFNLRSLPQAIENSLTFAVESLLAQVKESLDVQLLADDINATEKAKSSKTGGGESVERRKFQKQGKKGVIKPPKGQEEEWNQALLGKVEKMESNIRSWSLRIWNLERVLAKKRDPATRVVFADHIASKYFEEWKKRREEIGEEAGDRPATVYSRYWVLVTKELEVQFEKVLKGSPYIRTALGVRNYPKLRRLMRVLLFKLKQSTSGKSVPSVGGSAQEAHQLLRALRPFLEVYLARSLHRLNEPVTMMFPESRANTIGSTR